MKFNKEKLFAWFQFKNINIFFLLLNIIIVFLIINKYLYIINQLTCVICAFTHIILVYNYNR